MFFGAAEARNKMSSDNKKVVEEGCLALFRSYKALPKSKALIKYLSEPGVKTAMIKTEEFYMQDNNKNMHIVTDPLLFVIDEKNNQIELTDKGIDILTGNSEDPKFFVMPDVAAELAELANETLSTEGGNEQFQQKFRVKVHRSTNTESLYFLFEVLITTPSLGLG